MASLTASLTRRWTPAHGLLLALLLVLPSVGLTLRRGFDGLYGQDAYAYFDYATTSVRQSILHVAPLEAFFWPPGYPLLVAVTSLVVGPTPLAGQVVSLLMGALVPVGTALLVREIWPDEIALAWLAGALVALCGQLWQSSIVVMADTTGLALATLAAWALCRYDRSTGFFARPSGLEPGDGSMGGRQTISGDGSERAVARAVVGRARSNRSCGRAVPSGRTERSIPNGGAVQAIVDDGFGHALPSSGSGRAMANDGSGPAIPHGSAERSIPQGGAERSIPNGGAVQAMVNDGSRRAVRASRRALADGLAWLLLAAACLAYATLARWIYGLVGIPFAAFAVWPLVRGGPRRAGLHAAAALVLAAALLVPVLGPPLVGLLNHPADPAAFAGNLQVYSWSPLNAFSRDFVTADGHLSYAVPNGVYYATAPANLAFFGPFLAPWILVGLWPAVRGWQRRHVVLIVGWAAIVYAFHAGAPWQNFRFTLAFLPPLAILAACGLRWAWQRLPRRPGLIVALWTVVGLASMGLGGARLIQGFVDRKVEDLALVHWVEAQTPPSMRLFSFGATLTFRHYASYPTIDLYDVTPAELADVLATPAPTYVLLDEANVEQQWVGQAPSTNFHWLADGPGLVRVGDQDGYTLFRVGQA